MLITKMRDDIIKNTVKQQRQVAAETIKNCVDMGYGVYRIEDDWKTYPSTQMMVIRLRAVASRYSKGGLVVSVKTINKNEKVFVVVENAIGGKTE